MPGDPVIGSTVLRRPAIQSPNYSTGVSGWTVNSDGSAEFNNLTIRGTFNGTDFLINSSGIFLYNGAPVLGNHPVFSAVPVGVTQDPFGNAVSAVVNVGDLSGAHLGFDQNGVEYIADSSGATRIMLDPDQRVIEFYDSSGAGANPALITIASAAGTQTFTSHTFPAGISLSGLPLLTYSGTPAAGNLIASVAPAAGTDTYGNHFLSGASTYDNASQIATQLDAGEMALYTGTLSGGWTAKGAIFISGSGVIELVGSGVITSNNTLDDGSGNTSITGTACTLTGHASVTAPSAAPSRTVLGSTWNSTTASQCNANFVAIINALGALGLFT
jgi:hypothetical protein